MKDGDKLLAVLQQRAGIHDRYHQFILLFLRGRSYTPDWIYWKEWIDAHRS